MSNERISRFMQLWKTRTTIRCVICRFRKLWWWWCWPRTRGSVMCASNCCFSFVTTLPHSLSFTAPCPHCFDVSLFPILWTMWCRHITICDGNCSMYPLSELPPVYLSGKWLRILASIVRHAYYRSRMIACRTLRRTVSPSQTVFSLQFHRTVVVNAGFSLQRASAYCNCNIFVGWWNSKIFVTASATKSSIGYVSKRFTHSLKVWCKHTCFETTVLRSGFQYESCCKGCSSFFLHKKVGPSTMQPLGELCYQYRPA